MVFFDKLRQKAKTTPKSEHAQFVPGVGRMPYPAYRGKEPYIFISYCHVDSELVFAEVKRLNELGYHVWYDEGISPGNEWTEEIANALERCSVFLVMFTPDSARSDNVQNEIDFALDDKKPCIGIYLKEAVLQGRTRLRFGMKQAIMKYSMPEDEYIYKLTSALESFGLHGKNLNGAESVSVPVPVENRVENIFNDSPEDAKKRANGDLVRVDGFDIEHGSVKGYYGQEKNIRLPNSAVILGYGSFGQSRRFIESVDLNKAGCLLDGSFENCPNLHTVKIPETVTTIKMNAFVNCPNLTLYVRRKQLPEGFETHFRGKEIVYLDEPLSDAQAAKPTPAGKPVSEAPPAPAQNTEIIRFTPKGIATITMRDGTEYRAIANMLLCKGERILSGLNIQNDCNESETIPFSDISCFSTVLNENDAVERFRILDLENDEIECSKEERPQYSDLCFVEVGNPDKMETVPMREVEHVYIDHRTSCKVDLKMVLIKRTQNSKTQQILAPLVSLRSESVIFGYGIYYTYRDSIPLVEDASPRFSRMRSFKITEITDPPAGFKKTTDANVEFTDKYGETKTAKIDDYLFICYHTDSGYKDFDVCYLQEIIFRGEELDSAIAAHPTLA